MYTLQFSMQDAKIASIDFSARDPKASHFGDLVIYGYGYGHGYGYVIYGSCNLRLL